MKPIVYSLHAHDNLITRIVQNDPHLSFQNRRSDDVHLHPTSVLWFFMKQRKHLRFALGLWSPSSIGIHFCVLVQWHESRMRAKHRSHEHKAHTNARMLSTPIHSYGAATHVVVLVTCTILSCSKLGRLHFS